ncbi:MAG: hypothetical protein K2J72_09100 [Oscillospiraceae bacterium]|nr:hypothetical protein [Oscillospiraceae bacterium]
MQKTLSKKWTIILSAFFTAFNIVIPSLIYYDEFDVELDLRFLISLASLFAVYIISALLMKRKWDLSVFSVSFVQFGGFPMILAAAIAIVYIIIDNDWDELGVLLKSLIILKTIAPALVSSAIIQLIINALQNKSNSK